MKPTTSRFARIGLAVTLAAVFAPGAASAHPDVTVHRVSDSAESIRDYWTTDRMESADAAPLPTGGLGADPQRDAPGTDPATTGADDTPLPRASGESGHPRGLTAGTSYVGLELPWNSSTRYGYAPPLAPVGRLWMTNGFRYACTATAVAENIVVTAAHCMFNTKTRTWSKKIVFVPGVNGRQRPYGKFPARTFVVPNRWTDPAWQTGPGTGGYGYYGQDFAFVVLRPNRAGRNVGSVTGTYGLLANAPAGSIYALGYPYEGPFSSCTARNCRPWQVTSQIQRYSAYNGGKYDLGFSAYTSGGMSGGPFFQQWNGQWYVASVLSHGGRVSQRNGGRYFTTDFGSYFDNDTLSIFNYTRTQ